METRLDRLFILLDTATSSVTRKAAAQQLGEVQRLHPHELPLLLKKIFVHLQNPSWDTRIAASQAINAVISHVPQWDPLPLSIKTENDVSLPSGKLSQLRFSTFSISTVLANRHFLTASEGKEFDDDDFLLADPKERLARQRKALNDNLGLELAAKLGIDTGEIVTAEDLTGQQEHAVNAPDIPSETPLDDEAEKLKKQLSSREANRAKRKARQGGKQKSLDGSPSDGASSSKKIKKEKEIEIVIDSVPDPAGTWPDSAQTWPFESFCDLLVTKLLSPCWEVRHGGGTALREIIQLHGRGAGRTTHQTMPEMKAAHGSWLEDTSLRLLCVLALDRFGDFISDQVIAPVRETTAQALGSLAKLMDSEQVKSVVAVLLQLLEQTEWETRHGGLLGLKYLMAARQDLSQQLLPLVYPSLFRGLEDEVDDVSAVAAAALVPLADTLVNLLHLNEIGTLLKTLWDSLLELDELTASTSCILTLLSSLMARSETVQCLQHLPLVDLVPRLWPFLSHSSSKVRHSTLKTLETLLILGHTTEWMEGLASDLLRHVFQRAMLEHQQEILEHIEKLWGLIIRRLSLQILLPAACPCVATWLCMMMQPSRLPFDTSILIFPPVRKEPSESRRRSTSGPLGDASPVETKYFIAGTDHVYENPLHREKAVIRARCLAASMLGLLSEFLVQVMPGLTYSADMESPVECYAKLLLVHLNSRSAIQRTAVAMVMAEWGERCAAVTPPAVLVDRLHLTLTESIYYDEIGVAYARLLHDARDFIATLRHYRLDVESVFPSANASFLTPEQIQSLTGPITIQLLTSSKLKSKITEMLEDRRKSLSSACLQVSTDQNKLNNTTLSALARAVVGFRILPVHTVNPVVKPLMDSIKMEDNEQLQEFAARSLARLLELCQFRNPCPNNKILKNSCNFLCADPELTPKVNPEEMDGILMLMQQQRLAEKSTGGKKAHVDGDLTSIRAIEIQRRGAVQMLKSVASYFGPEMPQKVPYLWDSIMSIQTVEESSQNDAVGISKAEDLIQCLQILEVIVSSVHASLHVQVLDLLPTLCDLLEHPLRAVRHMASRGLAALGAVDGDHVLTIVIEKVIPMLGAIDREHMRQGAIEAVAYMVEQMGMSIIPFIVLLVIPVLGRMSDTDQSVRLVATQSFATLIRLMPLEGGVPDPPALSAELSEKKIQQRRFLEQLFDPKKLENYKIPVTINAELRCYQQDGVNWLAFLNKYGLHGILCDDMGLGKTLQTICIIASDHHQRKVDFELTRNPSSAALPSIVICPPTLTGHWMDEVEKFVSADVLNPLHYTGPPSERMRIRNRASHHNLIIASYDIVRNDLDFFSSIRWNFCVLDEGHVIKNGKTKLSKAIKQLIANHRLILSGTPIQNNVLELWSLFDFLIPGFLGSEKQFQARYSKPILASRDAKASSKEQENGVLAMESLHRQTLPFLLRRMKEDVLKDLPPKITQDYYCDLSPLQVKLYEDFSKKHAELNQPTQASGAAPAHAHIFQALQYLRKVCNHPKLVLTPKHPQFEVFHQQLKDQKSNLSDLQHASKLLALKQLLLDCGIGLDAANGPVDSSDTGGSVVSIHRALIFCQLRSMIDIIENDLLKTHMKTVSYLRLDGSIAAGARQGVVKRFNEDPSIDVLLLTTQVGGLGLNLTGADTVIFVEHDWNPMKDLQAMDRAHRIGQKKVVNVYRLITRGTLEEKIMGLQKFKLQTANTIISTENASLQSMGTEQLLDIFTLDGGKASKNNKRPSSSEPESASGLPAGFRVALESLPELWSEENYENEYNLDSFISTLNQIK
uniref:TATA-binding protein-associated factor n=1 Tax=Daphnia magna TaxID=35525 RepID=A0A0N8BMP5_9CRUS